MFKKLMLIVAFVSAYACLEASDDGVEKLASESGIQYASIDEGSFYESVTIRYKYNCDINCTYEWDKISNRYYQQEVDRFMLRRQAGRYARYNLPKEVFNKQKAVAQAWIAAKK